MFRGMVDRLVRHQEIFAHDNEQRHSTTKATNRSHSRSSNNISNIYQKDMDDTYGSEQKDRKDGCNRPKSTYLAYVQKVKECTKSQEGWHNVLTYANREVLPRLKVEEAAIQMLCQNLAYHHPRRGDYLQINIENSIVDHEFRSNQGFGNEIQSRFKYAKKYKTDATHACAQHGVVAWRLVPETVSERSYAAIIVFRGTRPPGGLLAEGTTSFNTGFADDLDPRGIGWTGFDRNKKFLKAWCEELLLRHDILLLCGHSLGGAYAAKTLACLPSALQSRTRLISFNSPAIDLISAQKILPYKDNVRLIRHRDDFVHHAGERHPRGAVITQTDREWEIGLFIPHSMDTFVRSSLNGRRFKYLLEADHSGIQSQKIEFHRRDLGAIFQSSVPL